MPRNVVPEIIQECGDQLLKLGGKMMESYHEDSVEYRYGLMIGGIGAAVNESVHANNRWPLDKMAEHMNRAAAEIEAYVNGTNN